MRRLQHNISMQPRMLAIHKILNPIKALQQSHKCISHLCKRKLLSNANPWSTVERNIRP